MTEPIPMLDLSVAHEPIKDEIRAAMERVMDRQSFILGPEVESLEAALCARMGVANAIGCGSGSDALVVALLGLDVGPGDEVITSTFSFIATGGAIVRVGATPVFADIDEETFNLDPTSVERRITSKAKAIMPVHLFGQMAPMGPILKLAETHGLVVVEDAAQAIFAREGEQYAGTRGDVGIFSFFPSKNLGALGDGGMLVTADDELARRLRSIRVHGRSEGGVRYERIGLNSRLDTLQAAVLLAKLPHVDGWVAQRRHNAARYGELFSEEPDITLPRVAEGMTHGFNQYTIRVPNRDRLVESLRSERIGCAVYYPMPLHLQPAFASLAGKPGDCPVAERASGEVVSLPVFGKLTETRLQRIADVVLRHVREHR